MRVSMAGMLRITRVRSLSGCRRRQMRTARSLGLSRLNKTVVHPDRPQVRGMIRQIKHLVRVEEDPNGS